MENGYVNWGVDLEKKYSVEEWRALSASDRKLIGDHKRKKQLEILMTEGDSYLGWCLGEIVYYCLEQKRSVITVGEAVDIFREMPCQRGIYETRYMLGVLQRTGDIEYIATPLEKSSSKKLPLQWHENKIKVQTARNFLLYSDQDFRKEMGLDILGDSNEK